MKSLLSGNLELTAIFDEDTKATVSIEFSSIDQTNNSLIEKTLKANFEHLMKILFTPYQR